MEVISSLVEYRRLHWEWFYIVVDLQTLLELYHRDRHVVHMCNEKHVLDRSFRSDVHLWRSFERISLFDQTLLEDRSIDNWEENHWEDYDVLWCNKYHEEKWRSMEMHIWKQQFSILVFLFMDILLKVTNFTSTIVILAYNSTINVEFMPFWMTLFETCIKKIIDIC